MNVNVTAAPEKGINETPKAGVSSTEAHPLLSLEGQNIICFAKDWAEDPTSCNHVLKELSKRNKVLWLNSISTRAPNLASGRDIGKIFKKLGSFFKGATKVNDNLWVYTPIVLPFHQSKKAIALNRMLLKMTVGAIRRRMGMRDFQLWTFVPTSVRYLGALGEDFIVYYVTDEWTAFSTVDGQQMAEMVKTLSTKANVVFATSRPLVEKLKANNPETHLANHGVNYAQFAKATEDATPIPADLAPLKKPVLGYYGLIEDWLDLDLIAYLAERHPEWSIALVGRSCVDTNRLAKYPNVHFLGRKPHSELPGYCKGFAVGMIPHKVIELTRNMNPIKLREYMSAGLHVVSTALPEVRHYPHHCTVTESYAEFEATVAEVIRTDTPEKRRERSAAMAGETWEHKVAVLGDIVMRARAKRKK